MTTSNLLRASILVAGTALSASAAWPQNPHAGTWETSELSIKEAAPGCRYVETVVATFQLAAGVNNTVSGNLVRKFGRRWWVWAPGCEMPGISTNPIFTLRQDMWLVSGTPQQHNTQHVKGVYAGCSTDCKDPWTPPHSFEMDLVRTPDGMTGELLQGIVDTTTFRDSYQPQLDASSASEAFMKLVRPLLEGKCDEFLLNSVDAGSEPRYLRDKICAFSSQLAKLVPTIIRDEKMQAFAPTLAQVAGTSGPLFISEGDVLVQRFIVVNTAGNGIQLGGVLRKQSDGSWRLRDLVP